MQNLMILFELFISEVMNVLFILYKIFEMDFIKDAIFHKRILGYC